MNASAIAWQGREGRLRVGLMAVAGLDGATRERIMEARGQGPFASMFDFLARVRPNADEATALIHAGALDGLQAGEAVNRGVLIWLLAAWQRRGDTAATLFPLDPAPPPLPPEDPRQRLRHQYRVLGFLPDRHPITLFAEERSRAGALTAQALLRLPARAVAERRRVRFLGWLITGKIVGTKRGEPMEFLTFEDETGLVECTLFPRIYEQHCHLLATRGPLLLEGYVDEDFAARTLTVERIAGPRQGFSLDRAVAGLCRPTSRAANLG